MGCGCSCRLSCGGSASLVGVLVVGVGVVCGRTLRMVEMLVVVGLRLRLRLRLRKRLRLRLGKRLVLRVVVVLKVVLMLVLKVV